MLLSNLLARMGVLLLLSSVFVVGEEEVIESFSVLSTNLTVGRRNRPTVATGWYHACAIVKNTGGVECWGSNVYGQLGDKLSYSRSVVNLPRKVIAVTAGDWHSCALLITRTVMCWGYNLYGQLGDGTISLEKNKPAFVKRLGGAVSAIAAGFYHTCALLKRGHVTCWGNNERLQIGTLDLQYHVTPVRISHLADRAIAITAGSEHTCALLSTNKVQCWGSNAWGQLGVRPSGHPHWKPIDVVGLYGKVTAIAAGGAYTCALLQSGRLMCWGENEYGQIGDGTSNTERPTPVKVRKLPSSAVAITAGYSHTCVLLKTGSIMCWGASEYGQLGDGTYGYRNGRLSPVAVSILNGTQATEVSAGGHQTCARLISGEVKCWGLNIPFSG